MIRQPFPGMAMVLAALALCGCRQLSPQSGENEAMAKLGHTRPPANLQQHVRNNCASLLHNLLGDEKNLSKLLIIKRESDELDVLVKGISTMAGDGAAALERLAQSDPTLHLDELGLPSGEAATREAEAKTTQHELLHGKGAEFEFKLLLTQLEALNYGAHLAQVAAANASSPDQARTFSSLNTDLKRLYDRTLVAVQTSRDSGVRPSPGAARARE